MLEQGKGSIFNVLGGGSDGDYHPGMGVYGTTARLEKGSDGSADELSQMTKQMIPALNQVSKNLSDAAQDFHPQFERLTGLGEFSPSPILHLCFRYMETDEFLLFR